MEKNVAAKWVVFAYGLPDHANPGQAITGDAANITGDVYIDGGAANAIDDTNPAELGSGYYIFDLTATETNGDLILIDPASSTSNVQVIGVPGAQWTRPANFNAMGIESDGDLTKVNTLDGHTAQTGDNYARLGAPAGASVSADIATVDTVADGIQTDLDNATDGLGALKTLIDALPAATDIVSSGAITTSGGAVSTVTTVTTTTTNTDMLTAAAVNAEVDTALADAGLDHLISASVTGTDIADDSIIAQLVSASATADWDDFDNTTDALQAIRDRGDSAWTTGAGGSDRLLLADTTIATLATQTSFTLTAGSADDDAYNNCTIVVEDVSTSTQKSIGMVLDYTGSTKTVTLKEALAFTIAATDKVYILAENSLKSTVANRQLDVTATGAAGIDWANVENPTTALDLSGTDIQLVDTTTTNTDMLTAAAVNAECDTAITDAALATAANLATVDTVVDGIQADLDNATDGLGAIKAETALIVADTGELQTDWADGGRLDVILDARMAEASINTTAGAVDSVTLVATTTTNTDMLTAAAVNGEVLDVINVDTYAEPGQGAPGATVSLAAKINYLYKAWRNKSTQTATTLSLYDDAGSTVDQKSTVSDDATTATRGEMETGP